MIACVILAAGRSSRMGDGPPKALLSDGAGRTFLGRIAATARAGGAASVLCVVGPPHGETIRRALPAGVAAAWNAQPDRGMLSSVQAGLGQLPAGAAAALIWPVDVPLVRAETVQRLIAAGRGRIALPAVKGKGGHPLYLPRARFAEVLSLDPARGLKALLDARAAEVLRLAVDDPGVLHDVDTPADLRGLSGRAR